MAEFTDVTYEIDNGVATVTLNRPEKRNAIRSPTLTDLHRAFTRSERTDRVTVVIIDAVGDDVFCAGADLAELRDIIGDQDRLDAFIRHWHRVFGAIADSPLPSIACVEGAALAGGLELVAACDLAVAGRDAEFGDQHVSIDLIPGGGNTQRLPRLIGPRRAKELLLTGKRIDAHTAYDWGLVNLVADDATATNAVREFADQIAEHHEMALARIKELVNDGTEAPLEQALSHERTMATVHLQSDVARESLDHFLGQ